MAEQIGNDYMSQQINNIANQINSVEFKSAGIFTNALLHTQDTTDTLRDAKPEENLFFNGKQISDIDEELISGIVENDEALLIRILGQSDQDDLDKYKNELSNFYSNEIRLDMETVFKIKERFQRISLIGKIPLVKSKNDFKVEELGTSLSNLFSIMQEVDNLQRVVDTQKQQFTESIKEIE
ncbi:hypothetical protein DAMA08_051450 [Martiniozyma asiatica (nom. inval.)]|nr:hypothetical protein DAMA08_051450 [Martiniozyma asiatica]